MCREKLLFREAMRWRGGGGWNDLEVRMRVIPTRPAGRRGWKRVRSEKLRLVDPLFVVWDGISSVWRVNSTKTRNLAGEKLQSQTVRIMSFLMSATLTDG